MPESESISHLAIARKTGGKGELLAGFASTFAELWPKTLALQSFRNTGAVAFCDTDLDRNGDCCIPAVR